MVTLKQLQVENRKLKDMQSKLREVQKTNVDRQNLLRENKQIARRIKFDKTFKTSSRALSIAKSVGKSSGKQLARAGVGAFKGIQRYGRFLEAQERKQNSTNRKLKSANRKRKSAKKTKRR